MLFDTPIPFQEALAVARDRGLLPTRMSSEELRQLESAVKRRAVFSARLDRASVLQVIKDEVAQIVGGDVDGAGRLRSIPEAKARIREALFRAGVPLADSDTPELQDFYSDARRQLIVETQVLDTLNHGRWVADQDEDLLDAAPAWELVRVVEPLTRGRDWPTRWDAALRATTSAGATSALSGRMVALKNHPVWQALGDGAGGYKDTLGNPWPPFAFNSGMNVVDVLRDEAESLGILRPGQRVRPETLEDAPPELSASLTRFDPALRAALAADPALRVQGNTVAANDNPDQPRDDEGKFAEIPGGGGGGGSGTPPKPAKRIKAREAEVLLQKGFEETDAAGTTVRFGARLQGKLRAMAERDPGEALRRLEMLPNARETVKSGNLRVVDRNGEKRHQYTRLFRENEKDLGFLVVVDADTHEAWNYYRKDAAAVLTKLKDQAGNDRQTGGQPPEPVPAGMAAAGTRVDWLKHITHRTRLQALCKAVARVKSNTPHSALRTPHLS